MAEISLSVYQNRLDDALAKGNFNEVIAHCRHILITYPKNIKAYSQMGQALYSASRWDESAELFRRLLGSLPNDFVAHHHLGQIYQRLERYDDAIWHTERAYDQQPNNTDVINYLRRLYRDHRGKDIQRLQLTAGAVAQQHIRNGLYQQAVTVLNKALARYPSRIDLKVLRIRALWQAEKHLDAAEGAIEVLEVLPYSLIANRILTELWLLEQRPSDAQRYLSRIEDLDPYMAYRIATGDSAIESLITIEELDYEAISRHELATTDPDWLNTLGEIEQTDADDELVIDDMEIPDDIVPEPEEEAEPKKVTDDLENLLDDDWQSQVDAMDETSSDIADDELEELFGEMDVDDLFGEVDDDVLGGDTDDLLGSDADTLDEDFDDLFGDMEAEDEPEPTVKQSRSSTDELNLPEGMHTDDLPDGLLDRIEQMKGMSQHETMPATNRPDAGLDNDMEDLRSSTGLTGMLSQLDAEEEDLSWLTDAQLGEFDAGDSTPLADTPSASEVDSDWLEELEGLESSPDAQRVSTGLTGMFDEDSDNGDDLSDLLDEMDGEGEANLQSIDPDDPNAWMAASGIEFDPDAQRENLFSFDDEESTFESADVSPVAWLGGDDDADTEADVDPTELDPMAWLDDSDVALEPETDNLATPETPDLFDDIEDSTEVAPELDEQWLGDDAMLDEMLSLEEEEFEVTSSTDNLFGDESDDVASLFEDTDDDDDWSVDDDALDELMEFDPGEAPDTDNLLSSRDESDDAMPNFFDDLDDEEVEDDYDDDDDAMPNFFDGLDDEEVEDGYDDDDEDDDDDDINDLFDDFEEDDNDDYDDDDDEDDDDDINNLFDDFEEEDDDQATEDEWMGDEDMLDEMLSMEDDDIDFGVEDDLEDDTFDAPTSEDWQDTMNDDFNNDWQPEQPDDEQDPLAWLNDTSADGDSSSASQFSDDAGDEEVDLEDIFAEMSDEELDDEEPRLEWLETDEMAAITAEEGSDDEEDDPLGWLNEEGIELEGEEESESTGMTDMLNALGDEDDEDSEGNFIEDHEEAAETGSWLDRVDLGDNLPAASASDEWLETSDEEPEADWLAAIDDNGEFEQSDADSFNFEVEEDDEENLFDFEDEDAPEAESPEFFNFDDTEEDEEEFDFEPTTAGGDDEPDWLSALDSVSTDLEDEDEIADEEAELPEQPDWLAAADDFEGEDNEAAVAEQPDWLSDVTVDEEEELEQEVGVEDTAEWLNELGDLDEDEDDFDLDLMDDDESEDEVEAEQPEQPDWLTGVEVAGAGAAAAMAANELFGDEEDDAEEDSEDWLAEADDFEDDEEVELPEQPDWLADAGDFEDEAEEAVAEEDSGDWLAEADDFEDEEEAELPQQPDWLADAGDFEDVEEGAVAEDDSGDWLAEADDFEDEVEQAAQPISVTGQLNWIEDEDDEHSAETAIGATVDADYLEDVDPATAASALDWMTDAEDDDEVLFDEPIEEQPQGITDFLNGDDEEEAEEEPDWLATADDFGEAEQEPDWLAGADEFEDEPVADGSFDFEDDDTIVGRPDLELEGEEEQPDWLAGMGEGDGIQDVFAEDADDIGWEAETTVGEAVHPEEEPDWLSGMDEGDGVQDAFAETVGDDIDWGEEDEFAEFAEKSSADDSFDAINDYETEIEPDVTYEEEDALPELQEEFSSDVTQESRGISEEDYLADFEEDTELAPAEDAPDWLNAMVPGLDIDYEADEDEPVDQGFIGEPEASTADKGFDWLTDIVDEETGAMPPVVPKPQPVTAPRFQFSKPPVWLAQALGGGAASSASVASVAQEAGDEFDDFDDDLPDWLEVDDE